MTYENNLKRIEEARKRGDEKEAVFWEERNKRKYPDKVEIKKEVVKEKPKKKNKKVEEN